MLVSQRQREQERRRKKYKGKREKGKEAVVRVKESETIVLLVFLVPVGREPDGSGVAQDRGIKKEKERNIKGRERRCKCL